MTGKEWQVFAGKPAGHLSSLKCTIPLGSSFRFCLVRVSQYGAIFAENNTVYPEPLWRCHVGSRMGPL